MTVFTAYRSPNPDDTAEIFAKLFDASVDANQQVLSFANARRRLEKPMAAPVSATVAAKPIPESLKKLRLTISLASLRFIASDDEADAASEIPKNASVTCTCAAKRSAI